MVIVRRRRALRPVWCFASLVLAGCAGESARQVPVCQAAWQELVIADELRPFYPEDGAWQSGNLVALSFSGESVYGSRERGLVYAPRGGFSVVSDADLPAIGMLAGAAALDGGVTFISIVDENGIYDVSSQRWRMVPQPGTRSYVQTTAAMGAKLAISYDHVELPEDGGDGTPAARFATYAPADATWRDTSEPPLADWHAPSLAWTGQGMLAWGGVDGERKPVSAAASYDLVEDAWTALNMEGAPVTPGGAIVWTGPEAVAWGGGR